MKTQGTVTADWDPATCELRIRRVTP
jgi:hypothetical protein